MFYFADFLRTQAQEAAAQMLWGTAPKRLGRSQDIEEFCNKNQVVEIQKISVN